MSGITQSTITYGSSGGSGVSSITNGTTSLINNVKIVGDGTTATTTYNATNNQVTISAISGSSGVSSINNQNGAINLTSNDNSITINNNPNGNINLSVPTGAGGVQSVSAGTNTTVDNTDPQNPIISAVSSGVTSVNGILTTVNIVAGNFITVESDIPNQTITISATSGGSGVTSINGQNGAIDLTSNDNSITINNNPNGNIDLSVPTGAGGVQSISAGTNITVDNTDPQNPVISATGGAGGGVTSLNSAIGTVILQSTDQSIDIDQTNNIIELSYIRYDNYLPNFTSNPVTFDGTLKELYRYSYSPDPNNLINYLMTYTTYLNPPNYIMKFSPITFKINNPVANVGYYSTIYLYLNTQFGQKIPCGRGELLNKDSGILVISQNMPFELPLKNLNSTVDYYGVNAFITWEFSGQYLPFPSTTHTITLSTLSITPLINWNINAGVVL